MMDSRSTPSRLRAEALQRANAGTSFTPARQGASVRRRENAPTGEQ